MEVHPPHEPVHTWREALIHIGLMTVGLFIALMLEGLVEYLHHKHLVHEARENIRLEIEHNQEAVRADIADVQKEGGVVAAGLKTMHFMKEHPHGHGSITYNWKYRPLSDAAWLSARDTGALGYMPYADVQGYSVLYSLQSDVSQQLNRVHRSEVELVAPILAQKEDFATIPPDVFNTMTGDTARVILDMQTLESAKNAVAMFRGDSDAVVAKAQFHVFL